MRILLDECVPRALKRHIKSHEIRTVPEVGWASKKNGELLELAKGRFDVFLTVDQNLQYQQNLLRSPVAVLLVIVPDNSIDSILPLLSRQSSRLWRHSNPANFGSSGHKPHFLGLVRH